MDLQEKIREHQKELHVVSFDLEKAYDTVARYLFWYCLRKRGVPEAYVSAIKDMRGRPKKSWMDTMKDDMLRWGLSDVGDRIRWHSLIELGTLQDRHLSQTTAD